MGDKIVAVIPVRAGSVRVKDKNIQILSKSPLVDRKIQQLNNSILVSEIVVGTNSNECINIAKNRGVTVINRDEYHCDEQRASANEMILDIASRLTGDIVVWSHCTNPFLYGRHYDEAIKTFLSSEKMGYDSLVSVQKIQSHMWDDAGLPANYDPYLPRHTLAKYIKPVYFQDGGIFIQRKINMIQNSYFFGKKPILFEVDFPFCHDINTQFDLDIARSLASWMDVKENFQEISDNI